MDDRVNAWLAANGLAKYGALFSRHEITFDVLPHLTDSDLREIGLPLGPRKLFGAAIADWRGSERRVSVDNEAERKQLTVMFCDMVGSTNLSLRFDPEEFRDILGTFHDAVTEAIGRNGGHVARYMGDGVLAYFGWPQAFEDQAGRALAGALGVVRAVDAARTPTGEPLEVRIGIATGTVVVGGHGRDLANVTGETPNLAQRLQSSAEPGQIVIDRTTRDLAGDAFNLARIGDLELKGFPDPVPAWRVVGEGERESRFESIRGESLSPLVGRSGVIAALGARWRAAEGGNGQVVFLSGEAGIGKSRLVQAFCDSLDAQAHRRLRYQCSPLHTHSALYPIVQRLRWDARFAASDDVATRQRKLIETIAQSSRDLAADVPVFAELISLPVPAPYEALDLPAPELRQRFIATLLRQVIALAQGQPLLLVLEDAHWIDPTTEALLAEVANAVAARPVMLLITARPEFKPATLDPAAHAEIALERLTHDESLAIIHAVGGEALPRRVKDEIIERADGIPLYVEEVTKTVLESDDVNRVPASVESSFAARLDRLGEVKRIAQIAAALGRTFSYGFLGAVSGLSNGELIDALNTMTASGLLQQREMPPAATYRFKHALIQDVAYESLLHSRRRQYHHQIAEVLLRQYPAQAAAEPETLARHLSLAGRPGEAVDWWLKAGHSAARRSAHVEAVATLEKGLADLNELGPSKARDEREFDLRIALGASLLTMEGWSAPRVAANYQRAHEISSAAGDVRKLFVALRGQANVHFLNGELRKTKQLINQLIAIATQDGAGDLNIEAYRANGMCALLAGEFETARRDLERANGLYGRAEHHRLAYVYGTDPGVVGLSGLSWAAWFLGDADASTALSRRALDLAQSVAHPFSTAYALGLAACLQQFRRLPNDARTYAQRAVAAAEEHDFPYWNGWGRIVLGWSVAHLGDAAAGRAVLKEGISIYRATGARQILPYALTLLAEVESMAGADAAASQLLGSVLDQGTGSEARFYLAESWRLRGITLSSVSAERAAKSFQAAVDIADVQGATLVRLRALAGLQRVRPSRSTMELIQAGAHLLAEDSDPDSRRASALLAGHGHVPSV